MPLAAGRFKAGSALPYIVTKVFGGLIPPLNTPRSTATAIFGGPEALASLWLAWCPSSVVSSAV